MSWLYDAVKRIEEENLAAGTDANEAPFSENGDSFLQKLESMGSLDYPSSKVQSKASVLRPQENMPERVPETSSEKSDVVTGGLDGACLPTNGYRKLSIPVTEDSRLVFHSGRHGLAAEQYRLLRRNLIQDFPHHAVLMITSPGEGDGKTLTALNLATCLAESGEPTLLLELDTRKPTLAHLLGCEIHAPGIEDALIGKVRPHESVYFLEELSLHAAMIVQTPRDPSQVVNSKGVREFLAGARQRFRWIIIDSAPVLPAADVADLLSLTDGVLMVIRAYHTPKDLTKRALELLGRRLHSVIFNDATVHLNPQYRYLSRYYQAAK